jgi:prolyl oligopeptidase
MTVLDNVEGILIAANWEDQKWSTKNIEVPPTGSINIVTSQPHSDTAYVTYESYLNPTTLFKVDNAQLKRIRQLPEKFNPENLVAEKKESVSADGTKIPFVVVHPKNQKGPLPTLLFGYGGFEISLAPSYYATVGKVWLDRGFAFAVANIRGGGEFGPNWHKAALKNQRAKAFEDFESVAEQLIKLKVTSSRLLAIRGGSNGGLLVGASMLRRPELYAAVICEVPLLDMIRYHRLLAGASWMEEYGNPDQSRDFKYLLSYSPYQNIRSVKYPEPFLFTSTMDDRVHPGHARKFVAKLLSEGHPVTYYENLEGGHARAADLQQLSFVQALQYSYLLQKLTQ